MTNLPSQLFLQGHKFSKSEIKTKAVFSFAQKEKERGGGGGRENDTMIGI